MDAPPATPVRRALRASLWIALALTGWTTYLVISEPSAKFVILALLFVPPMFAAYYLAALLPSWLAFRLIAIRRSPVMTGAAVVAVGACGLVAPFLIFSLFVPHYLRPEYRAEGVKLAPSSDFVAPWGSRMIALQIPAHELAKRPASMLWVAETELTRGEYARLMSKQVEGDAQLPMTSLSREQVAVILAAMNKGAAGRYRLPTLTEVYLYSGDWWINRYPKSFYRCQSKLEPVETKPANGLGLRGTVDNSAELVVLDYDPTKLRYCATQGGVESHCGSEYREGSFTRSVGLSSCEDRKGDKVWKHPGVGIRVVFSTN